MRRIGLACACCLLLGGCSQYYILTAPEVVAPADGVAVVIVRLQRHDPYLIAPGVKDASVSFRVSEGQERVAYTDDAGYAGTVVPVPKEPGVYPLSVFHMDREGDQVSAQVPVYVWKSDRPIVAVDLDCLPRRGAVDAEAARFALEGVVRQANILYMTRLDAAKHADEHKRLADQGYPDGPILLWQGQNWRVVRDAKFAYMPRVVFETRLVSQLTEIRKLFPLLEVGVCDSDVAARAFHDAALRCVVIGTPKVSVPNPTRRSSWAELREKGIGRDTGDAKTEGKKDGESQTGAGTRPTDTAPGATTKPG